MICRSRFSDSRKYQVITGWQSYSYRWDPHSWLRWRMFIKVISELGQLSTRLNDQGKTPADSMVYRFNLDSGPRESHQRQGTVDICSDLLNARGFMTHMALDWRHKPTFFNPMYDLNWGDGRMNDWIYEDNTIQLIWQISDDKKAQGKSLSTTAVEQKILLNTDIDVPQELIPLLYRSSDNLIALLREGVNFDQWINSYTRWPTGLALLLESGCKIKENSVRSACEASCEESIKLLIDNQGCCIGPDELKTACNHYNTAIMELVVNALVDRRRRLQALVEACLPEGVIIELGVNPGTLMSFQAQDACQLLEAHSFSVQGIKEKRRWRIYDYIGINLTAADLLWNSGFEDVDEMNDNETCLLRLWRNTPRCSLQDFMRKANWLIKKGASLTQKSRSSSVWHVLGRDVGKLLHQIDEPEDFSQQLNCLSQSSIDLILKICLEDTGDGCCCPCSSSGCSGSTALLHGMFLSYRFRDFDFDELLNRLAIFIEILAGSLDADGRNNLIDHIAPHVLRFITCQALDISHTCIREYRTVMEAEEIEEIHEEERDAIFELETLLSEFLAELEHSSQSFSKFLTGYWQARMNEFLSARVVPSAETLSQIRDIGVLLDG